MSRQHALAAAVILASSGLYAQTSKADVPMAEAVEAAQTAIAACKARGYNVTVTVLDSDLSIRVVLRGDGVANDTIEFGRRKAYTVIRTGMTSGEFGKTVLASPAAADSKVPGPAQSSGAVAGDPNLITWAGGLPIKTGNKIVGSIGVSGAAGGEQDEACAKAGLVAIAGRLR